MAPSAHPWFGPPHLELDLVGVTEDERRARRGVFDRGMLDTLVGEAHLPGVERSAVVDCEAHMVEPGPALVEGSVRGSLMLVEPDHETRGLVEQHDHRSGWQVDTMQATKVEHPLVPRGTGIDVGYRQVEVADPGGGRPVLILTWDHTADRIGSVVVTAITRTVRGLVSELELNRDAGVPTGCVVNFENIPTIPPSAFRRQVTYQRFEVLGEVLDDRWHIEGQGLNPSFTGRVVTLRWP